MSTVVLTMLLSATVTAPAGMAGSANLDSFAKCLSDRDATMYGSFWCSHCDDQKKLFGSSFRYIHYVECSVPGGRQMTFACQAAHIRYTPTWVFADGEHRTGVLSLEQLRNKTRCPLQ